MKHVCVHGAGQGECEEVVMMIMTIFIIGWSYYWLVLLLVGLIIGWSYYYYYYYCYCCCYDYDYFCDYYYYDDDDFYYFYHYFYHYYYSSLLPAVLHIIYFLRLRCQILKTAQDKKVSLRFAAWINAINKASQSSMLVGEESFSLYWPCS